ncbi:MAG: molybdenum cofactor guanylyltransferase [bacterium]
MISSAQTTGVILAGGKSTRIGREKSLLSLKGKPLIQYALDELSLIFQECVIISNQPELHQFLNRPMYQDLYQDCGPLGGMHSAFVHTTSPALFFSTCDSPFITKELIEHLLHYQTDALVRVPRTVDGIHPLFGLYSRSCAVVIERQLKERNFRVQDLFNEVSIEYIPIGPQLPFYNPQLLMNVNLLSDLEL